MGIEHEKIHLETTTMLIRQLPLRYIKPNLPVTNPFLNIYCNPGVTIKESLANSHVDVPGGEVTIGRPMTAKHAQNEKHAGNLQPIYGWDNEFGYHSKNVSSF